MILFEIAQKYIYDQIQQENVIDPEIVLQLLTMCRDATDAHLSAEQQTQLDVMIVAVVTDIMDLKK